MDWRREVNGKRQISFEGFWSKATWEGGKEGRSYQRHLLPSPTKMPFLPVSALIEPRLEEGRETCREQKASGKREKIFLAEGGKECYPSSMIRNLLCPICGTVFLCRKTQQKYCNERCRRKAERLALAERRKEYQAVEGRTIQYSPTTIQLDAHVLALRAGNEVGPLLFRGEVPSWEAPPDVLFVWEPDPAPGIWVMRLNELDVMALARTGNGEVTIR